jgi:lipoprotein-anchoring transpeptidase ErfK/SrfK
MRNRSFIAVAVALTLMIVGAVALYAYDSSNEDQVANGVTVGGVSVGGLSAAQARAKLRREIAAPLEKPVSVTYGKRTFNLSASDAGLHADVGGMVDEAVAASRSGDIFSRSLRDLTGGEEDAQIDPRVSYSKAAVAALVTRVRKGVDRPAQDAKLNFPSLTQVKEQDGVEVNTEQLQDDVVAALRDPQDRSVKAVTTVTKAKVTRAQLADKYPTLLVVDRGAFRLRLYKRLRLKKTYTVAVGAVGFDTPTGLYNIQNKGVNVPWSVPNKPWAGSLAGKVIPGGSPDNPIKARWLGIYDGAGIHGTDQVGSLGSAASHGCVRMAIPDVIELYDEVPVSAPVYIA